MASEDGVPLSHYLQHANVQVLLICTKCARWRELDLRAVIRRLKARGLGNERTGIRRVAQFVSGACGCGQRGWETRPFFPPGRGRC